MEIVKELPPNYDAIAKAFHFSSLPASFEPIFTYGNILYNPFGGNVSPDLMAHEETHVRQQEQIGVEAWWNFYMTDRNFRMKQEAEAYQNQYRFILEHYSRPERRRALQRLASDFSSALYGNLLTKKEAEQIIANV